MIAYEFYWRDEIGKEHFIGILPERRAKPESITKQSVLNWGRMVLGNNVDGNNIFFVQTETDRL